MAGRSVPLAGLSMIASSFSSPGPPRCLYGPLRSIDAADALLDERNTDPSLLKQSCGQRGDPTDR
jgi:hypothetical protein